MSVTDEAGRHRPVRDAWLDLIKINLRAAAALLSRKVRTAPAVPTPTQLAVGLLVVVAVVVATMSLLDAWAIVQARRLPRVVIEAAARFTDLGKSSWFLWPLGVLLAAVIVFAPPAAPRIARGVLAAWAVRLGFVFTAIALPSLFVTIAKRLIGRSRPFVDGLDIWAYHPLSWHPKYASFPSGHGTTAFAALVAIGAVVPQARALLWIYAVLMALSRVVVTAHHPGDVVAAAIVGAGGALLVQHWFAARRLGFLVRRDGSVHAMPGPSLRRITKAVARSLHSF